MAGSNSLDTKTSRVGWQFLWHGQRWHAFYQEDLNGHNGGGLYEAPSGAQWYDAVSGSSVYSGKLRLRSYEIINSLVMRTLERVDPECMTLFLKKLMSDEAGGEVLEYALIAGLIVIAAIAAITSVGTKVLGRWTTVKNSL